MHKHLIDYGMFLGVERGWTEFCNYGYKFDTSLSQIVTLAPLAVASAFAFLFESQTKLRHSLSPWNWC